MAATSSVRTTYDAELTMEQFTTLFPQFGEIELLINNMAGKCQHITQNYVVKHRELVNIFQRYRELVLRYQYFTEFYTKVIIQLQQLAKVAGTENLNIDDLLKKQVEIKNAFDGLLQKYSLATQDFKATIDFSKVIQQVMDSMQPVLNQSTVQLDKSFYDGLIKLSTIDDVDALFKKEVGQMNITQPLAVQVEINGMQHTLTAIPSDSGVTYQVYKW